MRSLPMEEVAIMSGTVRDVMTRTGVAARPEATFKELVRRMHEHRVSAVPIVQDGLVVGVVSEADLLTKCDLALHEWHLLDGPHRRAERRKAMGRSAREFMSAPAVTIGPDAPVADAAHLLREKGLKHLPVVDAAGRLLGMISRVDLLAAFLRGDDAIADDVSAALVQRVPDPDRIRVDVREGVIRVEGVVELRTETQRLVERLRTLDGVVAVDAERLDWEVDDTVEPVSTVPWVGF